jgi:hypothetical protein
MSDFDAAAVEMFDNHAREAGQRLGQCDVDGGCEVCAGSSEGWVFLFHDVEHYVARFLARCLVRLAF